MYDFKPHHVYKVSPIVEDTMIRGRLVVFYKMVKREWDITRAAVKILNPDGSSGQEWLINPHYLIKA